MASSTSTTKGLLTTDEIDDLIYACRTDDLQGLEGFISAKAFELHVSEADIIAATIDVDEDGLGSRACLLHYPAANGKLETLEYLLSKLGPSTASSEEARVNGTSNEAQSTSTSTSAAAVELVNHRNVSGNTPLHWAALNGRIDVVKALVKAGADPTIVNEAGRDAVVEAEYSSQPGAEECAVWLLRECDVLERGTGALTAEGEIQANDEEGAQEHEEEGGERSEKEKEVDGEKAGST